MEAADTPKSSAQCALGKLDPTGKLQLGEKHVQHLVIKHVHFLSFGHQLGDWQLSWTMTFFLITKKWPVALFLQGYNPPHKSKRGTGADLLVTTRRVLRLFDASDLSKKTLRRYVSFSFSLKIPITHVWLLYRFSWWKFCFSLCQFDISKLTKFHLRLRESSGSMTVTILVLKHNLTR